MALHLVIASTILLQGLRTVGPSGQADDLALQTQRDRKIALRDSLQSLQVGLKGDFENVKNLPYIEAGGHFLDALDKTISAGVKIVAAGLSKGGELVEGAHLAGRAAGAFVIGDEEALAEHLEGIKDIAQSVVGGLLDPTAEKKGEVETLLETIKSGWSIGESIDKGLDALSGVDAAAANARERERHIEDQIATLDEDIGRLNEELDGSSARFSVDDGGASPESDEAPDDLSIPEEPIEVEDEAPAASDPEDPSTERKFDELRDTLEWPRDTEEDLDAGPGESGAGDPGVDSSPQPLDDYRPDLESAPVDPRAGDLAGERSTESDASLDEELAAFDEMASDYLHDFETKLDSYLSKQIDQLTSNYDAYWERAMEDYEEQIASGAVPANGESWETVIDRARRQNREALRRATAAEEEMRDQNAARMREAMEWARQLRTEALARKHMGPQAGRIPGAEAWTQQALVLLRQAEAAARSGNQAAQASISARLSAHLRSMPAGLRSRLPPGVRSAMGL